MATRYIDIFAHLEYACEHEEESSKVVSGLTIDDDAIISLSPIEYRAAPEVVSTSLSINLRFIGCFDKPVLYQLICYHNKELSQLRIKRILTKSSAAMVTRWLLRM